ncbi:cupin domain-containing protein [Geovibrio thiophilus]|uniref:Cupin domain-containing protein n=1 Tax=Geovibrio thiophilus TaxID=139438 RepID=A0A410JYQ1_9BACT|nr:cupin domain-containing protein [Geovibrio thiophilus]QAR33307.1 cupin domain-containing protein [Geovibrio thiophilus]
MKKLIIILLLALSVSAFGAESASVKAVTLTKSILSWNGAPLPPYPEGQPEVTVLKITIPAGAVLPLHKHPLINVGVLISGELKVTTEKGDELILRAGEAIVEVVDTWHKGENTGDVPAEIIVFYAGAPETPLSLFPENSN